MPDHIPLARRTILGSALALPLAGRAFATAPATLPLVELRRYRTHPGKRDVLIDLFEREFVESQEAVGMAILGTFREPAWPDRFTWLRGFDGMETRARGLNAFYYGPVWQAHRAAANDCLADNDDVLLLREARTGSGFAPAHAARPPAGTALPPGVVAAHICTLADAAGEGPAIDRFERLSRPAREAAGARILASFVREKTANNFPRLPVHEDREVLVWLEAFTDLAAFRRAEPALAAAPQPAPGRPVETLVLAPTARSLIR
jgi:hypothetical protein